MKVLLVYPPITLHKLDVSAPGKAVLLGLGYIGAVLRAIGCDVKIVDCLVSSHFRQPIDSTFTRYGLSDEQIARTIESFDPDVVGVSCMFTSYFQDAHNVARIAKEVKPKVSVVFGGAHTTTFPEAVMKDRNVDAAVIGEGEVTICEVVDRLRSKEGLDGVKGVYHRAEGRVIKEEPREFVENLDDIPFPAWDLMEENMEVVRREVKKRSYAMRKPVGFILTSRGCPNNCYFCSVKLSWGRRWRGRSAKNVVDEIETLIQRYGYREINFVDDNSSVSKKRMHAICDEILKRGIDIKIATPTGIAINTLDKDLLRKMKKAGFYRLCFGIETGDPESQKVIKKRVDLERAKKVINDANKLGFWTSATFIIGHPHETMKEVLATLRFAQESNMDFAIFYLLVPQPGTEAYQVMKSQGLVDLDKFIDPNAKDWYRISITYGNGMKTMAFSNAQLQAILSYLYKRFLIHKITTLAGYINVFKKIRSAEDLRFVLRMSIVPVKMFVRILMGKEQSIYSVRSDEKGLRRIEV